MPKITYTDWEPTSKTLALVRQLADIQWIEETS